MRIVIIQGAFLPVPPIRGGAVEKIWYRMGVEFAKLGHQIVHISRSYPGLANDEIAHNVHYIRIPGFDTPLSLLKLKTLDLIYSFRAIKKIPKDVDVIVTNTFWAPILLQGKLIKKVYVDVQRIPKGQVKLYRNVGILRGCSPSIYDAIKKELPANFHSIISYIPNPVPFDVKSILENREKIILFVGRLHPEKGIHILIEAFISLNEDLIKDWKLVIIGPSEYKAGGGGQKYLNKLLNKSKNKNIEFVGPVYNDEVLIEYYARASIFCYPAQESSGDAAPVAPREAMAYGCVPVVSKLPCFADFISDKINGIIYDHNAKNQVYELSKALSYLIGNEPELSKLSEETKLVNKRFSAQTVAEAFIKDFEKILYAQTGNVKEY